MSKPRSQPRNKINGWINLNKPLDITSTGALNKIKWFMRPEKIGHAGTLDPLATGVLPVALGEGTKCINLLMDAKKTYEFTVTFGERRSTDDMEGEVVATSDHSPSESEIRTVLDRFTGPIQQIPPIYSAIKIDGERAYDLARAGEEPEMKPREVTTHALELLSVEGKAAQFRAVVSKGTYIRSLGRDIAQAAGSEGYISRLHRAAVGPFTDAEAISLDIIEKSVHIAAPNGVYPFVLSLGTALDDIPVLALDGGQLSKLRHGQTLTLAEPIAPEPLMAALYEGELVALIRTDGWIVSIVRLLNI